MTSVSVGAKDWTIGNYLKDVSHKERMNDLISESWGECADLSQKPKNMGACKVDAIFTPPGPLFCIKSAVLLTKFRRSERLVTFPRGDLLKSISLNEIFLQNPGGVKIASFLLPPEKVVFYPQDRGESESRHFYSPRTIVLHKICSFVHQISAI